MGRALCILPLTRGVSSLARLCAAEIYQKRHFGIEFL
jgi:hypothetical protein